MKDVKLLIFDMDDTLINHGHATRPAWMKTAEDTVKEFDLECDSTVLGKEIGDVSEAIFEDENRRPRGNYSPKDLRTKIIKEALDNLGIHRDDIIGYMVEKYAENKRAAVCPYDDVEETLTELKKRGYTITLLTNGDSAFQREKINRLSMTSWFDDIFISGEMGTDKPHKEAYYMIIDKYHVLPQETCMLGDNYLWEVVAPKEYGLKAIWVNRYDQVREDNIADYTIKETKELLDIFK